MSRIVSLIGAPTDVGASARGASMGPEALRVARLQPILEQQGLTVIDRGNVSGPPNPQSAAVNGYRHLPEVLAWNHAVHDAVLGELRASHLPILLGGDHSLAVGSIGAVARHCRETGRKLRVLWLDAHADFNTSALTPSGNLHGMPVACLCGFGPAELIRIGGSVPAIDPKKRARRASTTGTSFATGTPCLVMTYSVPVSRTRSISSRQRALNSAAATSPAFRAFFVMTTIL